MIKVLEHGIRKITCPNCKAKLQYEQEDVNIEKRPGGKQYIYCPDCDFEIVLNKTTNKIRDELDDEINKLLDY